MSYFDDLLKKPLPSKSNDTFMEGSDEFEKELDKEFKEDEDDLEALMSGCAEEGEEEEPMGLDEEDLVDPEDPASFDDDDDEFSGDGPEDMDSELDELLAEVRDEEDTDTFIPKSVDDPTPAPALSEKEDKEADRSMALLATPILLDETLTATEAAEFLESGEAEIAVSEGFMMESDLTDMIADIEQAYTESVFASPNKKFKMTKQARFKQLYEVSLQIEARHHNDPYYPKLQKAYKIERTIKAGWRKRYHALALRRAKRYLKRISMSKSGMLRKAATHFQTVKKK